MKACFTKNKNKNKNKRTKKKGKKYFLRQVLNPGPPTRYLNALPTAPRNPATDECGNLLVLILLPMKFCRSTPFEASRALFIKN